MEEAEKRAELELLGDEWHLIDQGHGLERRWAFKNFKAAIYWATRIGEIAEELKHHPDLKVGWGYCEAQIRTHTQGDLTPLDFKLAKAINRLENP